jgi:predicted permease
MLDDLLYRLRCLFHRSAMEDEMDDELRYHIEREAEKYRRAGMSPEEALRRARLALGGSEQVKQRVRESRGTRLLDDLMQDLRYALRSFVKTPGITFMIVLSLAIGIGANTAIFTVTSTLMLKPLPYPHADRLAILWLRSPGIGIPQDWPSPGQYHDIKTQNHVFEDTTIAIGGGATITGLSRGLKVDVIAASWNLLPMLGARPLRGRLFAPEDDKPHSAKTVILAYGLWQRVFSADPHILGRTITVDGDASTVVGVLAPDFRLSREVMPTVGGVDKPDLFMPLPEDAKNAENYGEENYNILARLKTGVTMREAQSDIKVIAERLRVEKHRDSTFTISVVPLIEQVVGDVRTAVLILFGAVALVLLIACTNVANLLLARATVRQREIAIRAALGAGRLRVIRQLLTESVLLALLGGAAGLGLAAGSLAIARRMHPGNIPRLDELGIDPRVLGFTLAVSLLTGIFFGLVPALRASRVDLTSSLKTGGRSAKSLGLNLRHDKVRGALVIVELAISLPLLAGAGLLVRSFMHLAQVPPGFNPQHVISMQVSAEGLKYNDRNQRAQFYQAVEDRVAHLSGVTAEGAVSSLPLTPSVGWGGMEVEGYVPPPNQPELQVDAREATPGYFGAMQIPLLMGRAFSAADTANTQPVVVIDQKMANRFWPHGDALGKRIRGGDRSPWNIVVGVVGVVKEYGLDLDTRMVVYFAHTQHPSGTMFLVARSALDPAGMAEGIVQQVNALDSNVPVFNVATMDQRVHDSVARQRFAMTMLSGFAVFAVILAAIGVYGVMSFLVSQGAGDIAIRMALGARPRRILSLVFQQGMGLTLTGILAGLLSALALTRVMNSLLFGVGATDPLTFAFVLALLIVIGLAACYFPARRATRVDPIVALRTE